MEETKKTRKWLVPTIVAVLVVLLIAGVLTGGFFLAQSAVTMQAQVHKGYEAMQENARQTALTVTEDGTEIGSYTLEQLGVLEGTAALVDEFYSAYDRMEPAEFARISVVEKLKWRFAPKAQPAPVAVAAEKADVYPIVEDLMDMSRQAPEDAYVTYEDGSFVIYDEVPGTTLQLEALQSALTQAVAPLTVQPDAAGEATVDVAQMDCYVLPEKTVENLGVDYEKQLEDILEKMTIKLDFHGETEELKTEDLEKLLSVKKDGEVELDEKALEEYITAWFDKYRKDNQSYLFKAHIGGVKPMDFLKVDYAINKDGMTELLTETLLNLQTAELEAIWHCWRKGEAFDIGDTYVEVDIPNQKMTYVKEGEVLVSTDIVSGATWGFPTPPGYYKVENIDTDCWLSGLDYNVHVDYWVGFIGFEYGIHDADWRTKFGGENYVRNGSHGCINTPKEAMATLFENIELGVPVLVYGK